MEFKSQGPDSYSFQTQVLLATWATWNHAKLFEMSALPLAKGRTTKLVLKPQILLEPLL